jgi:hypothetical protein
MGIGAFLSILDKSIKRHRLYISSLSLSAFSSIPDKSVGISSK